MRIRLFFLLAPLFAITSCSPKITSNIIHRNHPLESVDQVVMLDEKEPLPADAEWMGSVKAPAVSGASEKESNVYLTLGGMADFAYSAKSNSSSLVLALGVGYYVTPSLSLELGGSYSSSSLASYPDIKVNGMGVSASIAYHLPLARNLYYVPQFEVDYYNYSSDASKFNFVGMALVPLIVEYRADDSVWGFRAGIGEVGIAFPVSGTDVPLKSLYSVNLNSVSLGFVKYF